MKRKLYDNYHLRLFSLNFIPMTLVWFLSKLWVLFKLHTRFLFTLYTWLLVVYAISLTRHLYTSWNILAMVSIFALSHLLRYKVIIFKRSLVIRSELSVRRSQTSSLVKLSALSLILVKIYWLDNKNLLLVYH